MTEPSPSERLIVRFPQLVQAISSALGPPLRFRLGVLVVRPAEAAVMGVREESDFRRLLNREIDADEYVRRLVARVCAQRLDASPRCQWCKQPLAVHRNWRPCSKGWRGP